MKQLLHLLKWDFILLQRNQVIGVSAMVTLVYALIFKGLQNFGNVDKWLVLVIFNDPALLGFLFVGAMVLFEKNENTLQALVITPLKTSYYILSKAIVLTIISLFCCFAMAISAHGWGFQWLHYTFASIFTTLIFAFLGFIVVADISSFNSFVLRMVGVVLGLSLPFLGYFELLPSYFFVLFPTHPCIELYDAAFTEKSVTILIYSYLALIFWVIFTYKWALRAFRKNK